MTGTTAVASVLDVGAGRAASSEEPLKFTRLTSYYAQALLRGETPWEPDLDGDPIEIAAHMEAVAGLRRLRSVGHRASCRCCGCRTARFIATGRVPS